MRNVLLLAGALLPVISGITYVAGIIRGQVKPQRMTHFLLCMITGLSLVALSVGDDRSGIWLALSSFVQTFVVAALSVRRGIGGRDRGDWVCLVLCVAGVWLWMASGESLFGLAMAVAADAVACVPSLLKTYRLPHTESLAFYALDTVAGVCIVLAGPYSWQAALFPAYIAGINAVFVWLILWPRGVRRYMSWVRLRGIKSDALR